MRILLRENKTLQAAVALQVSARLSRHQRETNDNILVCVPDK
jgi:hypothetical protein